MKHYQPDRDGVIALCRRMGSLREVRERWVGWVSLNRGVSGSKRIIETGRR